MAVSMNEKIKGLVVGWKVDLGGIKRLLHCNYMSLSLSLNYINIPVSLANGYFYVHLIVVRFFFFSHPINPLFHYHVWFVSEISTWFFVFPARCASYAANWQRWLTAAALPKYSNRRYSTCALENASCYTCMYHFILRESLCSAALPHTLSPHSCFEFSHPPLPLGQP